MRILVSFLVALVLFVGVALPVAHAIDAGAEIARDAGPGYGGSVPAPAVKVPTPDDGSVFVDAIVASAKGGNWRAIAALGIVLCVWAARKWGSKAWKFLATDAGGALTALVTGVLSQLAVVIFGHDKLGWSTLANGIVLGFTAAGGWAVMKKIWNWNAPAPAPTNAVPPNPPLS